MRFRNVNPVRGENDPVDDVTETRDAVELEAGTRSDVVPGAIDPEIVVVPEPGHVGEKHHADLSRSRAELAVREAPARAERRASPETKPELRWRDNHVGSGLLLDERAELLERPFVPVKVSRTELTGTVVREPASGIVGDGPEHRLELLLVLIGEKSRPNDGEGALRLTPRDGKPRVHRPVVADSPVGIETRPVAAEDVDLIGDSDRLPVTGMVSEIRLHLVIPKRDRIRKIAGR